MPDKTKIGLVRGQDRRREDPLNQRNIGQEDLKERETKEIENKMSYNEG